MKDYKHLAMSFNIARQNLNTEILSGKEMYHLLTNIIGFGKDTQLLSLLVKKNILRHVSRDQYMFPENPVYYGKIQTVIQLHNRAKYEKYGMSLTKAIQICREHGFNVTAGGEA